VGKAALTLALSLAIVLVVIAALSGLFLMILLALLVDGPVLPEPPPFWPPGNLV